MSFTPLDGTREVYIKKYPIHNNYTISVDFNTEHIEYVDSSVEESARICVHSADTSNFKKDENFVILECVDRLLTKGYTPACLELEKRYPLGRREKGRLDILINAPDGTPYILIECKTWGTEFDKEQVLMNRTGGQLFSYYANERVSKFLCLYASKLDGNRFLYKNAIVPIDPEWVSLSGTKEIVAAWNGNFKNNGIFESDKTPYNVIHTALTYRDLQTITEEHSEKIFDLIMEILRHNVVSDKPNAFNKLLNLFVCKIIDEDRQPDEIVDFQLMEYDGKYDLQMRLNDLYKKGMWRFLNIRVTDYSQSEIEQLTAVEDDAQRNTLKEVITKLRLQKNPEFAFVEVCDDKTFDANDKILREIVSLLQGFKFRYAQKHQFLGDFFELLLSTSIKQESGQFFTPVPITRFILSSMPLKSKVDANVMAGEDDFLPTVIDYACGSGHFLTEYLEQMQHIIDTADFSKAKPSIRKMVRQYQDDGKFSWADKYVYGIDLDYRLVKTTKVSAFFNGDGEAKIVWANGLGNFESTAEYIGKLRNVSPIDKRDNASFDILISNPPYSVEAFKSTLDCGKETFELFSELTDKSKEIECLFVERMKQLLKPGGWAGVILPDSITTNGGIHAKAREILFKYFRFKAIAEMGSGTFMKTGKDTVILFLERRENTEWSTVYRAVETFFRNYIDVTVHKIEQPFSKYAYDVRGENFKDYVRFIKSASEETIEIEKDKLLYYILTYSQIVVLIKSGKKEVEKEFLGYKRSERRGREGLNLLKSDGKLFDESNPTNPQKVSSYIYNAFLDGEPLNVHSTVEKHVSYERLSSLINYNTSIWNKQIFLVRKDESKNKKSIAEIGELNEIDQLFLAAQESAINTYNLADKTLFSVTIGKRVLKTELAPTGLYPVYSANVFTPFGFINKLLIKDFSKPSVIWGIDGDWMVSYIPKDMPFYPTDHCGVLRVISSDIHPRYLAWLLEKAGAKQEFSRSRRASVDRIKSLSVSVPPYAVQQSTVEKVFEIEQKMEKAKQLLVDLNNKRKGV